MGLGASAVPDNVGMRVRFTKMQGAGNDFVVLDETRDRLNLSPQQYRWLADRHFGVGADQILCVRLSSAPGIDFEYVIHNADGGEVEHCGNGARCFMRFVRDHGLTDRSTVRVRTTSSVLELRLLEDGRVTVDMGAPVFDLSAIGLDPTGLRSQASGPWPQWLIPVDAASVPVSAVSMGNPHAVLTVPDVDSAPVASLGPRIERHPSFVHKVNVGFMHVVDRTQLRLRVWERGVGETLACGTGACAAVVAGIRMGRLDPRVDVRTNGGVLTIEWAGGDTPVLMTGPAVTVFEGEVEIPT